MRRMESYHLLVLVGALTVSIFSSSVVVMLPVAISNQQQPQYAYATFPGENGKIAFRKAIGNRDQGDIYVMNVDGSEQTRLTVDSANESSPDWSPDATKIAFVRKVAGNDQIFVMNADGSGETNISNNTHQDLHPSWSPDGTKIAFSSTRDNVYNEIYIMNADDGSDVTRLTNNNGAFDFSPSWSPDGTKIAFASGRGINGNDQIFVMNADGSGETNISNNTSNNHSPDWSPDGTKIAFASDTNTFGHFDIYVMNADGSEQTKLTNDANAGDTPLSWSPDGTKIAFASGRGINGNDQIFVMNADGSGETRLTNDNCCVVNNEPDWGPATDTESEDTTAPLLRVPEDITAQATTAEGGTVIMYTVTAKDNVDGTATLEQDNTLTQDDVGEAIDISCNPPSGSEFPIGETIVDCTATDASGNVAGPESFAVIVNPKPAPLPQSP